MTDSGGRMEQLLTPVGYVTYTQAGWTMERLLRTTEPVVENVAIPGGTLPIRFTLGVARANSESDPWAVELMFRVDRETKEIHFSSIWSGDEDADLAIARLTQIRPIAWWKRHALFRLKFEEASAALNSQEIPPDEDAANWFTYRKLQEVIGVPVNRKSNRVGPNLLQEVADVYRAAVAAENNPTQAVADHFHKSHSTAANWVMRARKDKYLRASNGSKGGEIDD